MRLASACHDGNSSDSRNPELQDTNRHIKTEPNEWSLIAMANTGLSPHAVVIELINTLTAGTAMRDSG